MNAETENTFRALKDEKPLATSFWCKLEIHRWEKWSKAYKPSERTNNRYVQHRHCSCCNKMEVQEVKLPYWLA